MLIVGILGWRGASDDAINFTFMTSSSFHWFLFPQATCENFRFVSETVAGDLIVVVLRVGVVGISSVALAEIKLSATQGAGFALLSSNREVSAKDVLP